MADGGASTMILLVTSLLISGAASVVLLESWGQVAESSGTNAKERLLTQKQMYHLAAIEGMYRSIHQELIKR